MQKNASGGQGLFVFLRAGAETPALWSAGRCLRMQTSAAGRHLRPALLRARPLVGGAVPSYAVFRGGAVPPSRAPSPPCLRSAGRHLRPALLRARAFVQRGGASVCRLPRQGGPFAPRFFVPVPSFSGAAPSPRAPSHPCLRSAGRCLRMQTSAAGRCLRPALLRARPLVGREEGRGERQMRIL